MSAAGVIGEYPWHRSAVIGGIQNAWARALDEQELVTNLSEQDPEIVVAAGAACSTAGDKTETSHVMRMITDDSDRQRSAIWFGLGKGNTEEEIDIAAEVIIDEVDRLHNRFTF